MADHGRVAFTKRLAQTSGFGIIIGLLVISTVMAWGVQESFGEQSVRIHRRLVEEQDLLTNLRRTLWAIGVTLRDYYLDPKGDSKVLDSRLDVLASDAQSYLARLRSLTRRQQELAELSARFDELVRQARLANNEPADPVRRFSFIQQEIVPRREDAARVLRDIERANHSSLTESEAQLQETRSRAARLLVLTLGACLFAGIVVAWFSIRHAKLLETEAAGRYREVLDAKQELERLSSRLMEVQEEERTRLSRELHDEIVQNLAVLKMEIVKAQTLTGERAPAAREGLARARQLAEETVRTVRNISLLLRPSLLDDLGLGPALQWQAEEFSRRTNLRCELSEQALSDDLPEAVKTCVYRVTQEALRNCEKHAQATSVKVTVEQTPGTLEVLVEDNGRGLADGGRKPGSLGLLGMQERASALGGNIEIGNRASGGTFVRMRLPLHAAADQPGITEMGVTV